jgi:hypothetical protein
VLHSKARESGIQIDCIEGVSSVETEAARDYAQGRVRLPEAEGMMEATVNQNAAIKYKCCFDNVGRFQQPKPV